MLEDVLRESTVRLGEVRSYLGMLMSAAPDSRPVYRREAPIAKGLFFVHLYGAFEFTVSTLVQRTIEEINAMNYLVSDCKPIIWSLVLDAECNALADVRRNRMWDKRADLFERIGTSVPLQISISLMPTDGRIFGNSQLESIWRSFSVQDPVHPRPSLRGRLEELVESRNAIAHGRESPAKVGARFTWMELEVRLHDLDELCTHLIVSLDSYLQGKHFLV